MSVVSKKIEFQGIFKFFFFRNISKIYHSVFFIAKMFA